LTEARMLRTERPKTIAMAARLKIHQGMSASNVAAT
jgi:hypothetical protein